MSAVKIKVVRSSPMGFITNRDGQTFECEKVGNNYRLPAPNAHLYIHEQWVQQGHAEIVKEEPVFDFYNPFGIVP